MPTAYDSWLEPDDDEDEEEVRDDRDDDEDLDDDPESEWGRRIENGRTIYEEDFIYDPCRDDM